MNAVLLNYRRGRHTQKNKQALLQVDGATTREDAVKLVGKAVEWSSPGKLPRKIRGKVTSAHGAKGVVRASFEKGLPGQAMGTQATVS